MQTPVPVVVSARTFFGHEMKVVLPEPVSDMIYRTGTIDNEQDLVFAIQQLVKPGMTFVDVGAHFGFFSLFASTLVGSEGRVVSLEPTPSTFEMLSQNAEGKDNIEVDSLAAWDKDGTIEFNDHGVIFSAWNSFTVAREPVGRISHTPTVHQVVSKRLDNYFKERNIVPDFIKLDVESAEYQVLSGLTQTLRNVCPALSLEVGDEGVKGSYRCKESVELVLSRGYSAYDVLPTGFVKHVVKDHYPFGNLLFIHDSKAAELGL